MRKLEPNESMRPVKGSLIIEHYPENETRSGIVLMKQEIKHTWHGKVVVADPGDVAGEVPLGSTAVFYPYQATRLEIDDRNLFVLPRSDVFALEG